MAVSGHDNQGRNVTDCHWLSFFVFMVFLAWNNESLFMVFEAT